MIDKRIKELVKILNEANDAYYNAQDPILTDFEYDKLLRELQELEKSYPEKILKNSPTQVVGAPLSGKLKTARHLKPMLSLANAMDISEVMEFIKRISKTIDNFKLGIDYKMDGLALSLVYEEGKLIRAVTRGDGEFGEEVTIQARNVKNIPHTINNKELLEVRGEIVMTKKSFEKLNKEREEDGEKLFVNPRNAASGSIRQLDPNITKKRNLMFFAHSLGQTEMEFESHEEILKIFRKNDFTTNEYKMFKSPEEIEEYYQEVLESRDNLEFQIDGLVIRVDNLRQQEELGYVSRAPRFAIAFKFPPEQKESVLKDVIVQVGRTGIITPVAVIQKTLVGGANVQRVTLHNFKEIERKNLMIGDRIIVQRAGDVIPEIVKPLDAKRTGKEKKVIPPLKCPECDSKLVQKKLSGGEESVALVCTNKKCPAQIFGRLIHFVSKRGMDIEGLGEKILEQLIAKGLIKEYADIFKLTKENFLTLEGFAEKSSDNLVREIAAKKKTTIYRFIYALGINSIGEVLAREVARLGSLEKLLEKVHLGQDIDPDEILGPVAKTNLTEYLKHHKNEIDHLLKYVEFEMPVNSETIEGNPTVVITGSFDFASRDEIQDKLREFGFKVASSVSKNTTALLCGEDAGSKLEKAKKANVPVIEGKIVEEVYKNPTNFWKILEKTK